MERVSDIGLLHPLAWPAFARLAIKLEQETVFRVFETWRHPARQQEVFLKARSNAQPWRSPHQYGLAVDFVPYVDGKWTWDKSQPWDDLRRYAQAAGLHCDLDWDRAHVEHPAWRTDFSRWMKKVR